MRDILNAVEPPTCDFCGIDLDRFAALDVDSKIDRRWSLHMQGEASGWLWLAMNVIMPILLLAALVYGAVQWRNRRRSHAAEQLRDQTTKENYRREEASKQG